MKVKNFLTSIWGKVLVIISACGVIAGGIKLAFSIDSHYAKKTELVTVQSEMIKTNEEVSQDLAAISKRLDQKILEDRLASYRQRYWVLTDRIKNETDHERIKDLKDEIRFLEIEINKIENQLENLK